MIPVILQVVKYIFEGIHKNCKLPSFLISAVILKWSNDVLGKYLLENEIK